MVKSGDITSSSISSGDEDNAPRILYRNGNEYTQAPSSSEQVDRPTPGVYNLKVTEEGIKLIKEEKYNYTFPKKIYGNIEQLGNAILRKALNTKKNTGVLLIGPQGTGKSLQAQYLIHKAILQHQAVVIDVHDPILTKEAVRFIQNLDCFVVMFIDEFEKKYNSEAQEKNLSIMDGSALEGVLWILTANYRNRIGEHYIHRPTRVYFHIRYDNVDMDIVEQIVAERLLYKELEKDTTRAISTFLIRTYDTILSFIDEINANEGKVTPADVLKYLNIEQHQRNKASKKAYYRFIMIGADKQEEDITSEYENRPMSRFLRFNDVFGDMAGWDVDEFTEVPVIAKDKSLPSVPDFKMDATTYVEIEDYTKLRFKVGETPAGKTVYLEFSKSPYPPVEPKKEKTEIFEDTKKNKKIKAPVDNVVPMVKTSAA